MYAVVLMKNGRVERLLGFVNSREEVDEISQGLIDKYGLEWLTENGYSLNIELAG